MTSSSLTSLPLKASTWSKRESASRTLPSAARATLPSASSETRTFSPSATLRRWASSSRAGIMRKSYCWQRERMVSGILWYSVVAKMNFTRGGGSSSVLRSALKAPVDSMWTSSMIQILKRSRAGL